ncbi:MAG: MmcQ/YjbR family DNA-binding protein [Myxococcaceae bacterium]
MREVTAALPETTERASHGSPSWFVKKTKNFASLGDNHHGDGRLALWLAATLDAQQLLVNAEPEHFFVPAYVGHLGWVGVRLDRGIAKKKVKALIEQAWRVRAPLKLSNGGKS